MSLTSYGPCLQKQLGPGSAGGANAGTAGLNCPTRFSQEQPIAQANARLVIILVRAMRIAQGDFAAPCGQSLKLCTKSQRNGQVGWIRKVHTGEGLQIHTGSSKAEGAG